MPELPEVETIVRELNDAHLNELSIERASVFWERTLTNQTHSAFCKRIAKQKIKGISRRGKYLVFTLSKDTLLVHLRMTGKFFIEDGDTEVHSHERIRLYLSDKRILRFEDQRKFGKWTLTTEPEKFLKKIGIEPLSEQFHLDDFNKLFKNSNRQIKPFLLDQQHVAGLGNIYVDEALWESKIHPLRRVQSLTDQEREELHKAIVLVLKKGLKNTGTSLGSSRSNYFSVSGRRGGNQQSLNVFRQDGLPCPRCQTIIEKIVVGQRGTHFCPKCQSPKLSL